MSHRNARLTVHGRLLIVRRHQARWKQAHIAAAMGVSRKCVKPWIDRFDAEGEAGKGAVEVIDLTLFRRLDPISGGFSDDLVFRHNRALR